MAKDVDVALKAIIAQHGGMPADKAAAYVAQMSREKRYLRDVIDQALFLSGINNNAVQVEFGY
jgi:hypothetical protein